MVDVASLGISVDSQPVEKGTRSLDKLSGAARKAEAAVNALGGESRATGAAQTSLSSSAAGVSTRMNAETMAVRANNAALKINASSAKMAAFQQRNLVFQLNDVFVSLASGMNPMMVAAQQGSQISQIYGPGEGGIGRAFKETGKMMVGALTKFPLVTAAVGLLGAAFAGMTYEINKTTKVSVGLGDVALASVQVVARGIHNFLKPAINAISPWFATAWNEVIAGTKAWGNNLIRLVVGSFEIIKTTVMSVPDAFILAGQAAANGFLSAIEYMIREAIAGINGLLTSINGMARNAGFGDVVGLLPSPMSVSLGRVDLGGESAAKRLAKDFEDLDKTATKVMQTDYLGKFFGAVRDQSIKNALGDGKKKKKGGKSEAEKEAERYAKIIRDQKQYIEGLNLEAETLGMSEAASRAMRIEQELLNKAQDAGIKLTSAQRAELHGLAEASAQAELNLAKAKAHLEGMKELGNSLGGVLRGLLDGTMTWQSALEGALKSLLIYLNKINIAGGGSGIFGGGFLQSLIGGFLGIGFAKGGVFQNGQVKAFAKGGVVKGPTVFPMAKGMGLMGEAGPEAVMPLQRGPNGALGVAMYGNKAANANQPVRIEVVSRFDANGNFETAVSNLAQPIARTESGRATGALAKRVPSMSVEANRQYQMRGTV